MRPVILIGAGGLAREVIAMLEGSCELKPIGLLDDKPGSAGTEMMGLPILGPADAVQDHPDAAVVVCTGSGRSRRGIVERLRQWDVTDERFATVVAPDVRISRDNVVGPGSIVMTGSVLTTAVGIGDHVVLMPNVVCTHDNRIGDFATLCAGTSLGGSVEVGDEAYLGMNSGVRQGLRVGDGAVLGMGSVLLTDVPAGEVWAGNPARRIQAREDHL